MPEETKKLGRGRPVTTDPKAVGITALRLFSEHGIDQITMDQVAEAAGISRSNLFRVFPSKAAVVWGGMHLFRAELEKNLLNDSSASVVQLLHGSWVETMHMADNSLETVRLRLKLIGSSPEVCGRGGARPARDGKAGFRGCRLPISWRAASGEGCFRRDAIGITGDTNLVGSD